MTHNTAILILAHHNPEQLSLLVNHLQPDFDIYVSIDKKSNINISKLPKHDNVFYYKEIKVYWGDFSLVKNMFYILNLAVKHQYKYYLFISGDDFPIKSNEIIKNFTKINAGKSFMYTNKLPINSWGFNHGFDRIKRYWFMKFKNRMFVKILGRITLNVQRIFRIENKPYPIDFYAGSQWVNLNKEAANYIVEFINNTPEYFNKLKYSRATDEIWIQSILMNSPLKNNIVNTDLRYIDWTSGPEFPRVLNASDFEKLKRSDALFARKFDSSVHEWLPLVSKSKKG